MGNPPDSGLFEVSVPATVRLKQVTLLKVDGPEGATTFETLTSHHFVPEFPVRRSRVGRLIRSTPGRSLLAFTSVSLPADEVTLGPGLTMSNATVDLDTFQWIAVQPTLPVCWAEGSRSPTAERARWPGRWGTPLLRGDWQKLAQNHRPA